MSDFEIELKHRIQKTDQKVRIQGIGWIAAGILLMVAGYFINTPRDRALRQSMAHAPRGTESLPPFQLAEGLSKIFMALLPFAAMAGGAVSFGYGGYRLAAGITEKEKKTVADDYRDELEENRIEEALKAKRAAMGEENVAAKVELRFDGIYTTEYYFKDRTSRLHLRFYNNGTVAVLESLLSPMRVYMLFKRHGSLAKVPDVTIIDYSNIANAISFSVKRTVGNSVEVRHYSGDVGPNILHLKIDRDGMEYCPVNCWNFKETPTDV